MDAVRYGLIFSGKQWKMRQIATDQKQRAIPPSLNAPMVGFDTHCFHQRDTD